MYDIQTESDLEKAVSNSDCVVIVTAHNEFLDLNPEFFIMKMKNPFVVDTRGVIDIHAAKKAGLTFRGLGRGSI